MSVVTSDPYRWRPSRWRTAKECARWEKPAWDPTLDKRDLVLNWTDAYVNVAGNNSLLASASVAGAHQGGVGAVNTNAEWSGATTTLVDHPVLAAEGQQIGRMFAPSFTIGQQLRRLAVRPLRVG
jgi:hypothetical protein